MGFCRAISVVIFGKNVPLVVRVRTDDTEKLAKPLAIPTLNPIEPGIL